MSETRRRRPVGLEFAALNKDTSVAATNARAVDDQLFDNTNVTLGDGQFANVKLVRLKQEFIKLYAPKLHPVPERAALKTCKVRVSANERSPVGDKLRRELDYYRRKCSHPNLIVYYKLLEQRSSPTPPSFTRIFMEYMDLRSLAHVAERLAAAGITAADRVELARAVGVQVLCALQYLHEVEGIMHRDIKEGNTLINTEGRVKLCDFDTAREIVVDLQRGVELGGSGGINALENGGGGGGGGARPILPPDTVMPGTESYTAPEVIKVAAGCRYNEKCDVWSFAVMIFKIATGTDAYKQRDVLRAGTTTFSSFVDFAKLTDDDLRDLLERCLVDDPQQRYTVTEALHHKFFTGDGHKFFDPNAALPSDTLNHLQLLGIRVGTDSEMSDMRQHLVEHRKSASKEKAASAAAAAAPTTTAATAGFQPAIPRSMTDGMLSPTASGLGDSVNRSNVVAGAASEADLTTMLGYDAQPTNGGTPRSSPPQTGLTNGATAMFPPSAVPQAVSDNQLVPNPDFTVPTNQSQQPPQPVVTAIPWTGEQRSQATSAYKQVVYRREAEAVKALKVLLRKYNIGEALDGTNSNNNNNNNNAPANVPLVATAA